MKLNKKVLTLIVLGGLSVSGNSLAGTASALDLANTCAGCHGVLRKGATGKNLEPKATKKLGQKRLEKILTFGTEGGMNNFNDIFSKDEIKLMATYIQMDPPIPPEMPLSLMQERTKVYILFSTA